MQIHCVLTLQTFPGETNSSHSLVSEGMPLELCKAERNGSDSGGFTKRRENGKLLIKAV